MSSRSLIQRLKSGLTRTRIRFTEGIANLILGAKTIDADLLETLEVHLLQADVGVTVTEKIMANLTAQISRKQLADPNALLTTLKKILTEILLPCQQPLEVENTHQPMVILLVGINGAGKTTTIGKLAHRLQQANKKILLAAGDTFRAAAVEQLQVWGARNHIDVVSQQSGADSAAVIYDALQSAQAKGCDVLLADTAGRLHNKENLLEELQKVKRVLAKLDATAPHEVMLVLDAGTGQNALQQAEQFHRALGITGITLTKLDGTAKGGILFAIAEQLKLPLRFIGVGEGIEDLRPFEADAFVEALFNQESTL